MALIWVAADGVERDLAALLNELLIMEHLNRTSHPNVIKLIGCCTQGMHCCDGGGGALGWRDSDFAQGPGACFTNSDGLSDRATDHPPMLFVHRQNGPTPVGRSVAVSETPPRP